MLQILADAFERRVDALQRRQTILDRQIGQVDVDREPRISR
jgi:hypothetical protein